MVNVALVGLGKMGILHGAIMGALPGARVVAACERNRVVRHFAKSALPNVKLVGEVRELAGLAIDAVYVATLPGSHHPVVRDIYEHGVAKHVFVEKSLAASHAQALEMCRLADSHGGVAAVGFQKRFGGTFAKAKEILEASGLGSVTGFEAYSYSSDFADAGHQDATAASRGGGLRDQGSHVIDLAMWFFGDLEVISPGALPAGVPPDFSLGRVRTEDGVVGTFSVSARMPQYRLPEIGMRITGSKASIDVTDDRIVLNDHVSPRRWHRQDLDDSSVPFLLGDPEYTREGVAFLEAVRNGRAFAGADFHAGARVERVIDGILAAA
jgi:predicted dehydrogenase